MYKVYQISGVFSMSSLGPRHDLVKIVDSGLYKNYHDENIIFEIDKIWEETKHSKSYAMSTPVMKIIANSDDFRTQNQKVTEFNSYCRRTDPIEYFKYLISVCRDTMNIPFYNTIVNVVNFCTWSLKQCSVLRGLRSSNANFIVVYYNIEVYRGVIIRNGLIYHYIEPVITPIFSVLNVAQVYTIGLISLCIGLIQLMKNKGYLLLCLGGGIFSVLLSVTLGTYAEWSRSMVYVLPFVYVSIAALLIDPKSGLKTGKGSQSELSAKPERPL